MARSKKQDSTIKPTWQQVLRAARFHITPDLTPTGEQFMQFLVQYYDWRINSIFLRNTLNSSGEFKTVQYGASASTYYIRRL